MSDFPVSVGSLYGALHLSSVLCSAFYGVVCMQTFFYYINYQSDPSRTKIFVAAMWAVNTTHQAFIISGTYKYIMAGLENPASYVNANPELVVQLLLTTPVILSTQGFFVCRICIFSNNRFLAPLIWLPFAMCQLAAALVYVANGLYSKHGAVHVVPLRTLGDTFFTAISVSHCAVGAGVDVLIAIFLTYLLIRRRFAARFKSTARTLARLAIFAVNSGIWTAVFSLLSAILVHALSSNLIYAVFAIPLCPIYCNALLANLNGRLYIRDDATVKDVHVDMLTNTSWPSVQSRGRDTNSRLISSADSGVWKTTEVVTVTDPSPSSDLQVAR